MEKIEQMGRNNYTWILLLLVLGILPRGCYEEVVIFETEEKENAPSLIKLDGVPAFEDLTDHFLLYTIPQDSLENFQTLVEFEIHDSIWLNGVNLLNGAANDLAPVYINHPYELIAVKGAEIDTFELIFTTLPLLRVTTEKGIPYEPKIESWFQLQYGKKENNGSSTVLFESHAGIEIRGMSANRFDKKSYGIELWENEYRSDRSAPLLGMGYNEDWILDAMYIDNLRMRNKFSFEVWNSMETLTTDEPRDGIQTGIKMEYVELFLNKRYYGLYCLGEKMDEKLIDFGYSQDKEGGVMYKTYGWHDGSTTFRSYLNEPTPSMEWDGWEQIYPDDRVAWDPLADLRILVTQDDDELFKDQIGSQMDLKNAANFYLFLNLILGWDNVGKNIYLARYSEQSRFFFLPWDVEATWGRTWEMKDSNPYGIIGNGLHERLISANAEGYKDSLSLMWNQYREGIFQRDVLMETVSSHYSLMKKNGVMQRENSRWDLEIDLDEEYLYISDWIEERLIVMDNHF